jgi:hypothetical protein
LAALDISRLWYRPRNDDFLAYRFGDVTLRAVQVTTALAITILIGLLAYELWRNWKK